MLSPHFKEKYNSNLLNIFQDSQKDSNLGQAIEKIFNETNNLNEIQYKLILLIKKYLQTRKKTDLGTKENVDADLCRIEKNITDFCRDLIQDLDDETNLALGKIGRKDRNRLLNIESKKNLKKLLKIFAIYEVYKVINPKRIAGETKKDNYQHNLVAHGEEKAVKYEGGSKADLESYGSEEVQRMQKQAAEFKNRKNNGLAR